MTRKTRPAFGSRAEHCAIPVILRRAQMVCHWRPRPERGWKFGEQWWQPRLRQTMPASSRLSPRCLHAQSGGRNQSQDIDGSIQRGGRQCGDGINGNPCVRFPGLQSVSAGTRLATDLACRSSEKQDESCPFALGHPHERPCQCNLDPAADRTGRDARAGHAGQAVEQRCGWVENPMPASWWLRDQEAEMNRASKRINRLMSAVRAALACCHADHALPKS